MRIIPKPFIQGSKKGYLGHDLPARFPVQMGQHHMTFTRPADNRHLHLIKIG
ncbi:hypothetical protein ES703_105959 [subsurface metagenome]